MASYSEALIPKPDSLTLDALLTHLRGMFDTCLVHLICRFFIGMSSTLIPDLQDGKYAVYEVDVCVISFKYCPQRSMATNHCKQMQSLLWFCQCFNDVQICYHYHCKPYDVLSGKLGSRSSSSFTTSSSYVERNLFFFFFKAANCSRSKMLFGIHVLWHVKCHVTVERTWEEAQHLWFLRVVARGVHSGWWIRHQQLALPEGSALSLKHKNT